MNGHSNLAIFYCLNDKKCSYVHYDGENLFLFVYDKDKTMVIPPYLANDIEILKKVLSNRSCEKVALYCTY